MAGCTILEGMFAFAIQQGSPLPGGPIGIKPLYGQSRLPSGKCSSIASEMKALEVGG